MGILSYFNCDFTFFLLLTNTEAERTGSPSHLTGLSGGYPFSARPTPLLLRPSAVCTGPVEAEPAGQTDAHVDTQSRQMEGQDIQPSPRLDPGAWTARHSAGNSRALAGAPRPGTVQGAAAPSLCLFVLLRPPKYQKVWGHPPRHTQKSRPSACWASPALPGCTE